MAAGMRMGKGTRVEAETLRMQPTGLKPFRWTGRSTRRRVIQLAGRCPRRRRSDCRGRPRRCARPGLPPRTRLQHDPRESPWRPRT